MKEDMSNIVRLGSLYLDDCPTEIEASYKPDKAISIGETVPGKEISWVVVNNMLIADRCILTRVSWDDLDAQNLVFGKEVAIGGFRYELRLLQVGAEKDVSNEWDAALDVVGEDNAIWHWEKGLFWGREITPSASYRAVRGHSSAHYWDYYAATIRFVSIGFRPVLVPLPFDHLDDVRTGETLMLWGGQNIVFGHMEQITNYDVDLSDWDGVLSNADGFGVRLNNGRVVIDRSAISGLQKS